MATDTQESAPVSPEAGGRGARRGGNRRSKPVQFYREVLSELRKVIYPGRRELGVYVLVVLVFVSVLTAFVSGLDYGLTKAVLAIFG
ncbi:MAG: preprotein translocase subunit SecE [Frankiaceae bacterium]|jgi:preprotein translocase subunit SecE|nr:preprotein translocase subunit SecE [Frankiaceae bacterium]MDQ1634735.1 preprotein translocase subunit SecE [Frankiaceae bacterium]MDQ1673005.1 preprotein translocase subunit SecE [Frankiaceae bacterium]